MKELNSWNMHQVYKEVEVSEARGPLITRLVIRSFQDIEKDTV